MNYSDLLIHTYLAVVNYLKKFVMLTGLVSSSTLSPVFFLSFVINAGSIYFCRCFNTAFKYVGFVVKNRRSDSKYYFYFAPRTEVCGSLVCHVPFIFYFYSVDR